MPDWVAVIVLGIIEGLTEFIPVSSTGHLLIAQRWLPRQSDLFNIVIQCGAVVAVLPLFPERLKQFAFRWREPETRDYFLKILVAFAITGAGGLAYDQFGLKLPETTLPVAMALFGGGALFLLVERWLRGRALGSDITWTVVLAVGIGQLIAAVFPGTSRSGATIILALMMGLNRPLATEFSFLAGIPTMLAAGGLKIFRELNQPAGPLSEDWGMVALGSIASAIVSFIAVKWLLHYVRAHTFVLFGWYRLGLAALLLVVSLF